MIHINNNDLYTLEKKAREVANDIQEHFGHLSNEQLNWKPNPKSWSIAQCVEHLIAANRNYFQIFEEILLGEKKKRVLERMSFLSNFWGKLLISYSKPESEKRLKSPKNFMPQTSRIDSNIIPHFTDNQGRLIGFMQATSYLDMRRTYITSPATRFVTYSLHDAYEIILQHERRHLQQALRVLKTENFPETKDVHLAKKEEQGYPFRWRHFV